VHDGCIKGMQECDGWMHRLPKVYRWRMTTPRPWSKVIPRPRFSCTLQKHDQTDLG
jgi:hypothetical protein